MRILNATVSFKPANSRYLEILINEIQNHLTVRTCCEESGEVLEETLISFNEFDEFINLYNKIKQEV